MTLALDDRESIATQASFAKVFDKGLRVIKLYTGDVAIWDSCPMPHSLGIERKTVNDLLSSLAKEQEYPQGRLRTELDRMTAYYDLSLVVVEGVVGYHGSGKATDILGRASGWNHNAVQAIILACQMEYPAYWLHTDGLKATISVVKFLHNRAIKGCIFGKSGKPDQHPLARLFNPEE